jgi:hypothetical protein
MEAVCVVVERLDSWVKSENGKSSHTILSEFRTEKFLLMIAAELGSGEYISVPTEICLLTEMIWETKKPFRTHAGRADQIGLLPSIRFQD